jgi:SAM-dependent methyltransferase
VGENPITSHDLFTNRLYANSTPLACRIKTHQRYTVPRVDFVQWVLDLICWAGDEYVLDIGCGSGSYVEPVAERLTGSTGSLTRVTRHIIGDLSLGMLRDLRRTTDLPTINLNATSLPITADSYDVVLANHVLHNVPDVNQAVEECRRVLRKKGWLLAATNSQSTMAELAALIRAGYDRLGVPLSVLPDKPFRNFSLENGKTILNRQMAYVERHILHSALVFREAEPLLAYVNSTRGIYEPDLPNTASWDALLAVWHDMIADHIALHGEFRVGKVSGAFVALKQ